MRVAERSDAVPATNDEVVDEQQTLFEEMEAQRSDAVEVDDDDK
eukprot:CAMPEP_0116035634 /NCGR_PEP_ID=MMETSP0321-20121206/20519_1 /TAXON_ID=163516 /ORGANISM="Leptocylindrus danicus var. danicus, Strain B650" /LENGTH=43 /DNA_ID= /DNA_START= /DNA_END= /DNA_ORIENTATION=